MGRAHRPPTILTPSPTVTLAAVVLVLLAKSALAAGFVSVFSVSQEIRTATLAAPTGLTASNGTCVVLSSTKVNLSWTATTSTWADGYHIRRSTTNAGPYTTIATVTGRQTTSYVDTTAAFSTRYHYVVRATKLNWTSSPSNQASITTPTTLCVV